MSNEVRYRLLSVMFSCVTFFGE